MANIIYDYLTENILFHPHYLSNDYCDLSETELENTLIDYREYITYHSKEIIKEIESTDQISVTAESFGKLPNETLFKQLVMYVDKIIVDDPIFSFANFEKKLF